MLTSLAGRAVAISAQPAFVIGRWTMLVWPVGHLSLRLAAETPAAGPG
ncbi:hypothetical protein [Nonomuraea insulae]|uniref:Uncharacterized protein n=1 Tax=Nonomuraea insulae TaxID=1616787 RepID=A0ABW1CRW1_9ACTN